MPVFGSNHKMRAAQRAATLIVFVAINRSQVNRKACFLKIDNWDLLMPILERRL